MSQKPERFGIAEPTGELHFRNSKKLYEHVRKHVFDTEEKWRVIPDFDAEMIRAAMDDSIADEDNIPLQRLAAQYEAIVSAATTEACAQQKNHLHFWEEYPPQTVELLGRKSSEPTYVVAVLEISKKMVIFVSKSVINGANQKYIINTAYRTNLKNKKQWYKQTVADLREKSDIHNGKQRYLTAEHLGAEIEKDQ